MNILKKNRIEYLYKIQSYFVSSTLFFYLFCCNSISSYGDDNTLKVVSFNVWNYFVKGERSSPVKDEKSRDAVASTIEVADPDIVILSEIGGQKSIKDLAERLKRDGIDYKYVDVMHGSDSWRYLGVLSKLKPVEVEKKTDLTYKIHPKKLPPGAMDNVPVQRGFLHIIFQKDDYKLHIVGVHLKARLFNSRYNQTDMRRFEARLLRYFINDILKKEPEANLLVVGDFNDTFSSDPLTTIRGDKLKNESKKLTDLKLQDRWHNSWTHWWHSEDSYSRIDYSLASQGLIKEINFDKSKIIHIPSLWLIASDHRALLTVITAKDKK